MTDETFEGLLRETFARCVDDESLRRAIVARVLEELDDTAVRAALNTLSLASPDELDRAVREAVERLSSADS
jgi:hypothetical protein